MALKNLYDMVKADRYTADGREAIIKAQEAETEDKVYQIGEISQKTGLQKTANGWVKPKNGKQPGAASKHDTDPQTYIVKKNDELRKMYLNEKDPAKKEAMKKALKKQASMMEPEPFSSTESKPDAADQRDQIGGEIKGNLEAAKYYFDKAQSFSPTDPSYKTYMLKAKQYNDEAKAQADDNGFDFEEMHNAGLTQALNHYAKEQEINPTKTYLNEEGRRNFKAALDDNPKSRYDFAKTVEFAVPMSQDDKIELRKLQMFMSDEGTDYKQALRSRASNLVDGNKSNGDWFPEKEKSIMKIAKAVGYDKELHKFIEEEYKGYDLGYSEDSAPRVLTGDTRIRVRKA